jgi:hypothetical protein
MEKSKVEFSLFPALLGISRHAQQSAMEKHGTGLFGFSIPPWTIL